MIYKYCHLLLFIDFVVDHVFYHTFMTLVCWLFRRRAVSMRAPLKNVQSAKRLSHPLRSTLGICTAQNTVVISDQNMHAHIGGDTTITTAPIDTTHHLIPGNTGHMYTVLNTICEHWSLCLCQGAEPAVYHCLSSFSGPLPCLSALVSKRFPGYCGNVSLLQCGVKHCLFCPPPIWWSVFLPISVSVHLCFYTAC